jgi:transcriptional regulator with XRE-family HTH domain
MEGNMDNKQSITNTLASNLRFLRINTQVEEPITEKIRFMSQRQLAEFMGSTCTQQVSKFELGTNQMSAVQLFKVAKIFNVSVDSLFGDLTKSDYKKTIKQDIYCL